MAALQFVDLVVPFEEDTPAALIELLKPDVLVKGGDYAINSIVGADTVLQNGGEVRVLPYIEGYSTTSLEEKIRNRP
jgi:bifunctional ADP-heptose synthase (sugar kinase/adenylyltransferase)